MVLLGCSSKMRYMFHARDESVVFEDIQKVGRIYNMLNPGVCALEGFS